jgi:hypothetical protein
MLNVDDLLTGLAKERPVFHSEADFQHSLAWQLHLQYPTAQIRLERVFDPLKVRLHIDIYCVIDNETYFFELKYKTCAASFSGTGEEFNLQNHSAYPPSRYDFVKDLSRLEAVVRNSDRLAYGFAILLTNDKAYWCAPHRTGGVSAAFCIHEGQRISGEVGWGPIASLGTKKNREEAIKLAAEYLLRWRDYSNLDTRVQSHFRYLCVPVPPLRQEQNLAN